MTKGKTCFIVIFSIENILPFNSLPVRFPPLAFQAANLKGTGET